MVVQFGECKIPKKVKKLYCFCIFNKIEILSKSVAQPRICSWGARQCRRQSPTSSRVRPFLFIF